MSRSPIPSSLILFISQQPTDGLLHQRLAWRQNRKLVQLGRDAGAVGIGFGGGQALAQLDNFFFAGTAPANLGTAAGCGHQRILLRWIPKKQIDSISLNPSGAVCSLGCCDMVSGFIQPPGRNVEQSRSAEQDRSEKEISGHAVTEEGNRRAIAGQ